MLTCHRLKKTDNDASYENGVLTVSLPFDGDDHSQAVRSIPVQ